MACVDLARCPNRVNVTTASDTEPRYICGCRPGDELAEMSILLPDGRWHRIRDPRYTTFIPFDPAQPSGFPIGVFDRPHLAAVEIEDGRRAYDVVVPLDAIRGYRWVHGDD